MSALGKAAMRELAACNGGPGLTAQELADRVGAALPQMRQALSSLVFNEKRITCGRDGRYVIGDPAPLLKLAVKR